jgi:glycosyltransferase involved in cell wall biosynthesis
MRILIVSDVSSHMRGGVPTETRTLVNGLVDQGHEVALAADAPMTGCERAAHFPISHPVRASLADEIERAAKAFQPDFVHVLCMSSKGVAWLAPLLNASLPWALTVHSVPPHERKLNRWHDSEAWHYGARALRFLANALAWRWVFLRRIVPLVIVHSRYVEDIVVNYGLPRARVRLIPLPFEAAATAHAAPVAPKGDAPLLVTVGGYAHTKGQHDVVKALPELVKRFPKLRYQMIGEVRDDSYVAYLQELAQRLGVADNFAMTPDLPHADKQKALAEAAVYVQPSHEEGFCLAYAEGAAAVPRLVGTDTGAIAAMSRDDPGARVVPPRDPRAMAAAIAEMLVVELPADHMARRALRMSERFSTAGYIHAHEGIYGSGGAVVQVRTATESYS